MSISQTLENSIKENHVNQLMNSIEYKLNMIANQEVDIHSFSSSKKSKNDELLHDYKQPQSQSFHQYSLKKQQLELHDLDVSANRGEILNISSIDRSAKKKMKDSRISNKIIQMEESYIKKITELNYKLVFLEDQFNSLQGKYNQIQQENIKLKHLHQSNIGQNQKQVESQVTKIKRTLMNALEEQTQRKMEKYTLDIKEMNQIIAKERKDKSNMNQQIELLKMQKSSIEKLYRELIQKHKVMIRTDMENHYRAVHEKCTSQQKSVSFQRNLSKQKQLEQQDSKSIRTAIKKPKKKEKSISNNNKSNKNKNKSKNSPNFRIQSEESQTKMTRSQLVPFLAKGIQQLKDKLGME